MKKPVGTKAARGDKVPDPVRFRLQLHISGATARSAQAIANIKAITELHLHGQFHLEIIDAGQQAALARDQQIVVLPTLIKHLPLPMRRMVGDLSDTDRVLLGLGLALDEPDETSQANDESDGRR